MSRRFALGLVVAAAAAIAQAQPEHQRIAAERAAAMARFAEQERSCREQFVVTACVEAARKEQRMTLARLHRSELVLADQERREAAARRRQDLQQRATVQEGRTSQASPAPAHASARPAPMPNAPAAARPQRSASSAAEQRAIEQRNEAAFEARSRAAQARREAVELRNAQRAGAGKAAAPLPVPSGASSP